MGQEHVSTEVVFQLRCPHPLLDFAADHPEDLFLLTPANDAADGGRPGTLAHLGDAANRGKLDLMLTALPGATPTKRAATCTSHQLAPDHPLLQRFPLNGLEDIRQALGADFLFEPLTIRNGWLTVRVLALAGLTPKEVVGGLQDLARKHAFEFRLVTISNAPLSVATESRDVLTDKQLKTIKAAKALGFYDTPKRANLETLAQIFGVSKAAVHSRLKAAERKIITEFTDRL